MRTRLAGMIVVAAFVASCSGSSDTSSTSPATPTSGAPTSVGDDDDDTAPATTTLPKTKATFTVQPGTDQIAVLGDTPGDMLTVSRDDTEIAHGTVDEQGSLLFRNLEPGDGYTVSSATAISDVVPVADPAVNPPADFYSSQPKLPEGGFGYITTRDGTTLSANVMLPGPADQGPYPTVVEYSGYQPSDPGSAQLAQLYTAMGFAYVGVNMRGTGCSGGSYRFFETVQNLDGYDAIETVAAQPWVLDNKVGMVGISYPGITQLFVAATQPPSLAAITPLSVIDDSFRSTLYPGRHPQHRLRGRRGRSSAMRRVEAVRSGVDEGTRRRRRHRVRRQPEAALAEPRPREGDRRQPVLPAGARRLARADHVRRQDQRAGVPRRRVAGRADRWPLPGDARQVHRRRRTST